MDVLTPVLSPVGAHRVTPDDLDSVPTHAGVYVVWIVSHEAHAAVGLPLKNATAIYVGQAAKAGIRGRISGRVRNSWPQLAEILAARGRVLFPWWLRYRFTDRRRYPRTPLAQLCQDQALRWQHQHLHWRFHRCARNAITLLEDEAVRQLHPLLNRRGLADLPPQLRTEDRTGNARARWLWHLSWAATVLDTNGSPAQLRSASDGFPVLDEAMPKARGERVVAPSERKLLRLLERAARDAAPEVRVAISDLAKGLSPRAPSRSPRLTTQELLDHRHREMRMWWAAHVAAPLLPERLSVDDALSASLSLEPVSRTSPQLPEADRIERLLRYIKRVLGERRH